MEDIGGIHERIQAKLLNQEKGSISRAEEILELPPAWNEEQDLVMEDVSSPSMNSKPEKRKREETDRGRRKRRYEEDLRGDKREHCPTESRRVHPPLGFYSED